MDKRISALLLIFSLLVFCELSDAARRQGLYEYAGAKVRPAQNQKHYVSPIAKSEKGKEYLADLNGDGTPDRITAAAGPEEEGMDTINIKVNDTALKEYGWNMDFQVVDLDGKDGFLEIAISDDGPSDDYSTRFYSYDGKSLIRMGWIGGTMDNALRMDGKGGIKTKTRGRILHTWFRDAEYKLVSERRGMEGKAFEEIVPEYYHMGTKVTVVNRIGVYAKPAAGKIAFYLEPGEKCVIMDTDDKDWCSIVNAKGKKGWFSVTKGGGINGSVEYGSTFFKGLCYAD